MTQRQAANDKAQGMADFEDRVMVVGRYADGDYFIRAAEDLDVEMTGPEWMARYGLTYLSVHAPVSWLGQQLAPMSAEDLLRQAIAARCPEWCDHGGTCAAERTAITRMERHAEDGWRCRPVASRP